MNESRRSILFSSLLVALAVFFNSGCSVFKAISGKSVTRSASFTFPLSESKSTTIRSENGSLTCIAADVPEIMVDAKFTARAYTVEEAERLVEDLTVTHRVENGQSKIDAVLPPGYSGGISLVVMIPQDNDLKLVTSNGTVRATGFLTPIEATTSNGKMIFELCDGGIQAKTSNGSIQISGDQLNTVVAKTSNGSVTIEGEFLPGDHQIKTSNGSITANLTGTPITMTASTSNGSIKANGEKVKAGKSVELGTEPGTVNTSGMKGNLTLSTSNGSIKVNHQQRQEDGYDSSEGNDELEVIDLEIL